ncbi:hypothetical protein [Brevibacillus sp. H7]|uniref:hypothetical protein n=1 Tax=Brevibacillus sp. H7 TaxID=3349138 RepID=UPI003801ABD6
MANFMKKLVEGTKKEQGSCCGVEIKEVAAEKQESASESCCGTDTKDGSSSSCCG